jgi:hypothetical protein
LRFTQRALCRGRVARTPREVGAFDEDVIVRLGDRANRRVQADGVAERLGHTLRDRPGAAFDQVLLVAASRRSGLAWSPPFGGNHSTALATEDNRLHHLAPMADRILAYGFDHQPYAIGHKGEARTACLLV